MTCMSLFAYVSTQRQEPRHRVIDREHIEKKILIIRTRLLYPRDTPSVSDARLLQQTNKEICIRISNRHFTDQTWMPSI